VGTPAASDLTLAPGAGHGDEGDASFQGPAQEETLSAQPKPTNAKVPTNEASSVITLAARIVKPEAVETAVRETNGLVMTRPKPEKRLNAKDRAKNRAFAKRAKGKPEAAEEVAAVAPEVSGLSTAHPKPEKRKNAKERAKEKYAKKDTMKDAKKNTADGTTPMTAKAKSKVETKTETKETKETNKAKKTKQSKAAA
jgi:hypothetical protein